MQIFESIGNAISSFGITEWGMVALILILLGTLFLYNKAMLKCKTKIEEYERELSEIKNIDKRKVGEDDA